MFSVGKSYDTGKKLALLSRDSQYDLACACGTQENQHRRRSQDDKWIYPVILPDGGTTFLFKTLLSNECVNDCRYCPLRSGSSVSRCTLSPEELAKTFMSYYAARRVSGLFLSSAVVGNPDATMERINRTAVYLRRMGFRGYIHLKIIPGASDAAIRQSLALAHAVSLNIENAREDNFRQLSNTKKYVRDIIRPIELISRLTARGAPYSGVKHTTQFVVGASKENDKDVVDCSGRLYGEFKLNRIYFSAYQRDAGVPDSRDEAICRDANRDLLTREHRLYQADWLIRKYGFRADEIPFEPGGNLSLAIDPKEMWARMHPEFFPVNINKDERFRLLRVPGFGQVMVERILSFRQNSTKIKSLRDLGKPGALMKKAASYVIF